MPLWKFEQTPSFVEQDKVSHLKSCQVLTELVDFYVNMVNQAVEKTEFDSHSSEWWNEEPCEHNG